MTQRRTASEQQGAEGGDGQARGGCRQQLRQRVTILVEAKKTSAAPNGELERNALNYSVAVGIEMTFCFPKRDAAGRRERQEEKEAERDRGKGRSRGTEKVRAKYEENIIH